GQIVALCCLGGSCSKPTTANRQAAAQQGPGATPPGALGPAVVPENLTPEQFREYDALLSTAVDRIEKTPARGEAVKIADEQGTFEQLGEFSHDGAAVRSLVFSGNGKRLVAATDKGTLTVWKVAEGMQEKSFSVASEPIAALAVSFDGKRAL